MPKRFDFGDNKGEEEISPPVIKKPRTFEFSEHTPKTLDPVGSGEMINHRRERPRTLTDDLIDRAMQQSPEISMEIRGRIDTLLYHTKLDDLINWGSINLVPLQQASDIQSKITAEMHAIGVVELLRDAKDATLKPMSLIQKISGKTPEFFDYKLNEAKRQIIALISSANNLHQRYTPEVRDLHYDAIALAVVHMEYKDTGMMQIGNSRVKTLLNAHQTGTMLLLTLENIVAQCATYIEQIDTLLSVVIPNWRMVSK